MYIEKMRESFTDLDTALADINGMAEDGEVDAYQVKAIFYSLFFGADQPRMNDGDYREFADCFVTYEEREDENGESYTVAVPIADLETVYANLAAALGQTISAEEKSNAQRIYVIAKYGQVSPGSGLPPGAAMGDGSYAALIAEAEKYLGYPYVFGGSSPQTSFDCSGFVCWVYTQSGVYNLPRTTAREGCNNMAKEKIIGICALCEKQDVELMQSHIIPKAVYNRTKSFDNSRFRNWYEPKVIFQDGEKKPMLCHDCEEFFSKYETRFSNQFLDRYLKKSSTALPKVSEDTDFYVLTVAWRILYDDLYVYDSFPDDNERIFLEEYERKLRKFLWEKYLEEHPEKATHQSASDSIDLKEKCFGEIIAEIEKYQKSKSPEDISEIKNYIFTLKELGFTDAVVKLFSSMIFGYSFYTPTRTKYYIISGYNGLVITTAYHRKRNILLTDDWSLLKKSSSSKAVVKQDITDEINSMISEMRRRYQEIQEKLDENGLREKIAKRYENQKKKN